MFPPFQPFLCPLYPDFPCVPSIPIPLLCVPSVPFLSVSLPSQPPTSPLHINHPPVPSIPTLYLSCRGHTHTRTCHPTEVPISQGPHQGGGVGVEASDATPQSLAEDQPGQTL